MWSSHAASCSQVDKNEVNKFHSSYATLLKSSMDSLKKKVKKSRAKSGGQ
jgi:hypothetical protein